MTTLDVRFMVVAPTQAKVDLTAVKFIAFSKYRQATEELSLQTFLKQFMPVDSKENTDLGWREDLLLGKTDLTNFCHYLFLSHVFHVRRNVFCL